MSVVDLGVHEHQGLGDIRVLLPPEVVGPSLQAFSTNTFVAALPEPAQAGDLVVVQMFSSPAPAQLPFVNAVFVPTLALHSGGLGVPIAWYAWVMDPAAGDEFVTISLAGVADYAVTVTWLVRGERHVGPYTPESTTDMVDTIPSTPSFSALDDGVFLGAYATLGTDDPGDPPAPWVNDATITSNGLTVRTLSRLVAEGTIPAGDFEDTSAAWEIVGQAFYGVHHAVGSVRGFVVSSGIVKANPHPPTPVSPTAPAADADGWPPAPDPTPIVVPTTAHRDGRYPTS